jgi:hypothetical protein
MHEQRCNHVACATMLHVQPEQAVASHPSRHTGNLRNMLQPEQAFASHPSRHIVNQRNILKTMVCASFGCNQTGTKSCSSCLNEIYCSSECQKTDWKMHKKTCHLIKMMSDELLPFKDLHLAFQEVSTKIEERITELGVEGYVRLLYQAAKFAEHHFGERIAGSLSYSRDNGDILSHWEVEIDTLHNIYNQLACYNLFENYGGKEEDFWTEKIIYLQKSGVILERWIRRVNSSEIEKIDIDEEKIDKLFHSISLVDRDLSSGYRILEDWDKG